MRLLIFGATGKTGKYLIEQGLHAGHTITAFVRNPKKLQQRKNYLISFSGNISNQSDILHAMKGQEVVISVLGNKTSNVFWKSNTTISEGLKNIIHGMHIRRVKRILFVTSFGISDNIFLPEKILINVFLHNVFADLPTQEKLIKESGLEYTIVRPARLVDGQKTGKYKAEENLPIWPWSKITRSDVADFILHTIQNKNMIQKTITLSY